MVYFNEPAVDVFVIFLYIADPRVRTGFTVFRGIRKLLRQGWNAVRLSVPRINNCPGEVSLPRSNREGRTNMLKIIRRLFLINLYAFLRISRGFRFIRLFAISYRLIKTDLNFRNDVLLRLAYFFLQICCFFNVEIIICNLNSKLNFSPHYEIWIWNWIHLARGPIDTFASEMNDCHK